MAPNFSQFRLKTTNEAAIKILKTYKIFQSTIKRSQLPNKLTVIS
jgi:hypothetical protein